MTKDYVIQLPADAIADRLVAALTQPANYVEREIRLVDRYQVAAPDCTVVSLVFSAYYARVRGFIT